MDIDFDFDVATIVYLVFGLAGGFLALIIMKSVGLGFFWKILTFVATSAVSFFVVKLIFEK